MFTAYEGQQLHSSLINALVAQEIKRQRAIEDRERAEALSRVLAERDMMRSANRRYWAGKIEEAEELYGYNPNPPRPIRWLEGLCGLIVYLIDREFKRLSAWNRG